MTDDSDDPVMALLATQRAVLAAVENPAGQIEAMKSKVGAKGDADRTMTIGDRVRMATTEEAAADPELAAAQPKLVAMESVIRRTLAGGPDAIERIRAEAASNSLCTSMQARLFGRVSGTVSVKARKGGHVL